VDPPLILTSRFANDGSFFLVTFDISTDRGHFGQSHACSQLFDFPGSAGSWCVWQGFSSVKVFPTGNDAVDVPADSLVEIGDSILVRDNVLRAKCPALATAAECEKWETASGVQSTLMSPLNPVSPVVSLSAPAELSHCKSYTLDLTASSGSGGRAWSRQEVNVSSASQSNTSLLYLPQILDFYRNDYSLSPPTALQAGYLSGNETYIFSVTLCNFLLQCHTSSVAVKVIFTNALPVVTIGGNSVRQMHRADPLTLLSTAFVGTCNSTNRYSGMKFQWWVTDNGVINDQLTSTSRNPFKFSLPGGVLEVEKTYMVVVSVTDTVFGGQSSASIEMTVIPSEVVAVISGGAFQSWRVGEAAPVVDGSGSFDLDVGEGTGLSLLNYSWYCDESQSTVALDASFCSNLMPLSNHQSSQITLDTSFMDFSSLVGASFVIQLRVEGSHNRSDVASVTVTVAESTSPKISLLSFPDKVNAQQRVQIQTSVQVTSAATGVWSVSDSDVDLAAVASIPSLSVDFPDRGLYFFNLAIESSTLAAGVAYEFILTVEGGQDTSTTLVTVVVVEPPRSGKLVVAPLTGSEFEDFFQFSSTLWTDDELPLSYAFGYFSGTGNLLELRGRGEASYLNDKYLPRGAEAQNFNLSCGMYAFNALDARSVSTRPVRVLPVQVSAEEFETAVLEQLTEVSGHQDTNAVKSIVSVGISILNSANCSLAPSDCGSLGREACADTPHTCGPCLEGYVGESAGDGNSPCFTVTTSAVNGNDDEPSASLNGTCVDFTDCQALQSCEEGLCVYPTRSCPSDCSGKGACQLEKISTGEVLDDCLINDFTCEAKCICEEGFLGVGCSETRSAMEAKRETRYQLISFVNSTMQFEDTDSESLTARIVLVSELGSNPSELTEASCVLLQGIIGNILTAAAEIDIPIATLERVLGVLDSCDQVYVDGTSDSTARLSRRSSDSTSSVDNNDLLRSSFQGLASKSMIPGEKDKEFIDTYSRSTISKNNAGDDSEQAIPQTTLEEVFAVLKTSLWARGLFTAVSSNSSNSFTRSIILEDSDPRIHTNSTEYTSNPIKVQYFLSSASDADITSHGGSALIVMTFQNNAPQDYYTNSSYDVDANVTVPSQTRFVTDCASPNVTGAVVNYTCPDVQEVSHRCTDPAEVITSVCPIRHATPVCRILSSNTANGPSQCDLVSFTSTSVTCNCTISLNQSATDGARASGRRQLFASSSGESSGFLEMAAMTEYTFEGFVQTNRDVAEVSVEDLQNGVIVIIMFSTLWGCGVLGLYELIRASYCTCFSKVGPAQVKTDRKRVGVANEELSLEAKKEYLMKYVDGIVPVIFRSSVDSDSPLLSVWKTIKTYHPYAVVFTADGPGSKEVKIRKGIYLLTIQVMLMFIMAVFCDLQFPEDDGHCKTLVDEVDCEAQKSMFDSTESTCVWVASEDECVYREVEFTVRSIMLIAVLIAIATVPVNMLVDFLFQDVISAPLADDAKVNKQSREMREQAGQRITDVATGTKRVVRRTLSAARGASSRFLDSLTVPDTVTRNVSHSTLKSHSSTSLALKGAFDHVEPAVSSSPAWNSSPALNPATAEESSQYDSAERGQIGEDTSFNAFSAKLFEQCELLSGAEKVEFQGRWGISGMSEGEDGLSAFRESAHDVSFGSRSSLSSKLCGRGKRQKCRAQELAGAIQETASSGQEKLSKLKLAMNVHIGLEVMHLFIIDLLGKNTPAARIFSALTREEFQHSMVVTKAAKRLAWLTVLLLNIFFVYFSVLRGITRSVSWQRDYLLLCVAEFLFEILVYETVECLWIHFAVPKMVSEEVATTMTTVKHAISLAFDRRRATPVLNSPKYFFVSHKLAQAHPTQFESSVVLSFCSYFPPADLDSTMAPQTSNRDKRRGVQEHVVAVHHADRRSFLMTFLHWLNVSVVVTTLVQHLGAAPIRMQKAVIHTLQPIALSLVAIMYLYFVDNPWMAVFPLGIVMWQVLLYVFRTSKMKHLTVLAIDKMPTHDDGANMSAEETMTLANVTSPDSEGVRAKRDEKSTKLLDMSVGLCDLPLLTDSTAPEAGMDRECLVDHRDMFEEKCTELSVVDDNANDGDEDVVKSSNDMAESKDLVESDSDDSFEDLDEKCLPFDYGSEDSDDSDVIVFPRGITDKKKFLLEWEVEKADNAVKECAIEGKINSSEDFEFYWDESSDEYRYLYQQPICPFVNSQDEEVSLYQIISRRNTSMATDYENHKKNEELAILGMQRRRKFMREWDEFRLRESDLILPFIDHTGHKVSVDEILVAREKVVPGGSKRSGRIHRKLRVLKRKKQSVEHTLLLHKERKHLQTTTKFTNNDIKKTTTVFLKCDDIRQTEQSSELKSAGSVFLSKYESEMEAGGSSGLCDSSSQAKEGRIHPDNWKKVGRDFIDEYSSQLEYDASQEESGGEILTDDGVNLID